ncbi:MAG: 3-oxoacyl-ACP synthase III [Oligoflexia bacterium]|nr:3-oxoacyl-ACP synthase III [Oligoflexia bacterium]
MFRKYEKTVIQGIETHYPKEVLTSEKMEELLSPIYKRLRLPEGRLELMTAIKSRGIWPKGTLPSSLASIAAKKVLEKTNTDAKEIDLLIHASVCRDFLEPATASMIHRNLELNNKAMAFDLSNACLGVINAICMASELIENGIIRKALIVSAENSGPLLENTINELNSNESINRKDIKKYIANLTIGSAACAIILSDKNIDGHKNILELTHSSSMTDSSANHLCQGDGSVNGLVMETDSEQLLHAGKQLAINNWNYLKEQTQYNNDSYQFAIGHQVGKAHEDLIMTSLGLEKHPTHITYPHMGNTGSAALPITLWEALEQKKINKEDNIILLGIGSGLTSTFLGAKYL